MINNKHLSFKAAVINYKNGLGKEKSVIIPDRESVRINSTDNGFEFRRPEDRYAIQANDITWLTIDKGTKVNFYNKNHKHRPLTVNEIGDNGFLKIVGNDLSTKKNENITIEHLKEGGEIDILNNASVKIKTISGGKVAAYDNSKLVVNRNNGLIAAISTPENQVELNIDSNEKEGKVFAGALSDAPEGKTLVTVKNNNGLLSLYDKCKCFIDKLMAKGKIVGDGPDVKILLSGIQEGLGSIDDHIELRNDACLHNLSA